MTRVPFSNPNGGIFILNFEMRIISFLAAVVCQALARFVDVFNERWRSVLLFYFLLADTFIFYLCFESIFGKLSEISALFVIFSNRFTI